MIFKTETLIKKEWPTVEQIGREGQRGMEVKPEYECVSKNDAEYYGYKQILVLVFNINFLQKSV